MAIEWLVQMDTMLTTFRKTHITGKGNIFFKKNEQAGVPLAKLEIRKAAHATPKKKENCTTLIYGPYSFAAWITIRWSFVVIVLLQITTLVSVYNDDVGIFCHLRSLL